VKEYSKRHYQNHKEKLIPYINAHRKGRLKDATPIWANKKEIRYFYVNCPSGFHVDHIIPLHGKNVSGLHVLENLQYLPAEENLRKGNKVCLI
jgi:5-methylcytosine-specific restriction endonuclease McrA